MSLKINLINISIINTYMHVKKNRKTEKATK